MTALTVGTGMVDDADILDHERVVDMEDVIDQLETDITQFSTALMKVASKPAISAKVEWLEDRLFPRLATLTATAATADDHIHVASGYEDYFRVGDIVRNAITGEAMAVSAAPVLTSTSIGVTRSIGDVAAATSASGADLVIIGNAAAQGATLGTCKVTTRVNQYNYCQIFRHPYSFSNTLAASKLYGGPEPMKERQKKAVEHKRALENTLFFGARDLNTGGSPGPIGYMGGLIEFITTNLHNPSGGMSPNELDTYLQTDLAEGSRNKVIFASPTFARSVSSFARDNWTRSTPTDTKYGVKVDAYVSGAYGYEVPVFVKKDWFDLSAASSQYGSWAFLVDMSAVMLRPLRTTQLLRNRQANDADLVTEEYLTEVSFECRNELKHAVIKDVTGPTAN
jgi:hypothetical protein